MIKIIFVTCPPDKADEIASHLLNQRVCACVSTVPGVESRYWWEGQLETAQESLLIIKCANELVDSVIEKVKEVHPYEVPEVVAVSVDKGNPDYLAWVRGDPRVGGKSKKPPLAGHAKKAAPKPKPAAESAPPARKTDGPRPKSADQPVPVGALDRLRPPGNAVLERVQNMKIVLLGPPGAGKGTQARLLSRRYGMRHVSSGDLFLKAVKDGSDLGKEVQKYTAKGKLVPDRTTNIIMKKELAGGGGGGATGFVLDGFPRTLAQAEGLAESQNIDGVFYINAPQEMLISRLTRRSYCDCGASYGPDLAPAIDGLCDSCGGMLYQREDDKPRNVLTRLEEYNKKTRELLRFYKSKLRPVDGSQDIGDVFVQICKMIER